MALKITLSVDTKSGRHSERSHVSNSLDSLPHSRSTRWVCDGWTPLIHQLWKSCPYFLKRREKDRFARQFGGKSVGLESHLTVVSQTQHNVEDQCEDGARSDNECEERGYDRCRSGAQGRRASEAD